jgi:hypothetical protein
MADDNARPMFSISLRYLHRRLEMDDRGWGKVNYPRSRSVRTSRQLTRRELLEKLDDLQLETSKIDHLTKVTKFIAAAGPMAHAVARRRPHRSTWLRASRQDWSRSVDPDGVFTTAS